jgi:lipopolysaccharide transport system ATP-binding protein
MKDISGNDGRTVLFVSHNMAAVKSLCTRGIVLENGKIAFEGGTDDCVSYYLSKKDNDTTETFPIKFDEGEISKFEVLDFIGNNSNLLLGERCSFELNLRVKNPKSTKINVRYQVFDKDEKLITTLNTFHLNSNKILEKFDQSFVCSISKLNISPGLYDLGIQILDLKSKKVLYQKDAFSEVVVESGDVFKTGKIPSKENLGVFLSDQSWTIK